MARRCPAFGTGGAGAEEAQLEQVGRCRQFQMQWLSDIAITDS